MNRLATSRVMSAREFNQNTSGAKQLADHGPLVITDRGHPAYVLMSHAEFERLRANPASLLDTLEQTGGPEYDFDIQLPERSLEAVRDPLADHGS